MKYYDAYDCEQQVHQYTACVIPEPRNYLHVLVFGQVKKALSCGALNEETFPLEAFLGIDQGEMERTKRYELVACEKSCDEMSYFVQNDMEDDLYEILAIQLG